MHGHLSRWLLQTSRWVHWEMEEGCTLELHVSFWSKQLERAGQNWAVGLSFSLYILETWPQISVL
jgi:hypothetical protein